MDKKQKRLQELTITDGFMFGAVMGDPENCRLLLERILDIPISRVEVLTEKSLKYRPEYKGVRLDVFAKDDDGTHFEVEMQVRKTPVERRSRYYHSQMDMEALLAGTMYENLPDSYVIFICCYDLLGYGKYRYTIGSQCMECPDYKVEDGLYTIILNNHGNNPEDVSPELVSFLEFTKKPLDESEEESDDPFVRRLQDSIRKIKSDRTMEEKYMQFEELLQEERKEGAERTLISLVKKGRITIEEAAEELNITPDAFNDIMKEYSHRDSLD